MAKAAAKSSCRLFSLMAMIFFRPPLKEISFLEGPALDLAASGSEKEQHLLHYYNEAPSLTRGQHLSRV